MTSSVIATSVVVAVLAAACAGADAPTTVATSTAPFVAEPEASSPLITDAPESSEAPNETLTRGGTLTYLVDAVTESWDIASSACSTTCMTIMRAVADPLTIIDADGEVQPFLLATYETNADFTVHTLSMRPGVMFHDGTPADGAAVKRSLTEMASGPQQGGSLRDLVAGPDSIVLVDDMTVELTFSDPYASFGEILAERTGYLVAPSYWDDSDRAGAMMVATGAFQMTEWTPDERIVVDANPDYWKIDAAGNPLPYLDEVLFLPVPDASERLAIMENGDADVNMDSVTEHVGFWSEEWAGGLVDPGPYRDTYYLLLDERSQFADPRLRRALALCTNRELYRELRAPDLPIADGPFAEGAPGYVDDPGFPEFDAEAGAELFDAAGGLKAFTFGSTNDPMQLLTAGVFAKMWFDNCGLDVTVEPFDESELGARATAGRSDVFMLRNAANPNPGLEFAAWDGRQIEQLSIDVGRLGGGAIDASRLAARSTVDAAQLDSIGQDINRELAENVDAIWLTTGAWFIATQPDVRQVGTNSLPGGGLALPSLLGRTWLSEAWIDD